MRRRVETDVELRVIAHLDIAAAGDPDRALVEREIAQLGGLVPATGPETRIARREGLAQRVAALGDEPRDDPMERRPVVIAGAGFLREVRDGIRRLVGAEREREGAALRELDGCLCSRSRSWRFRGRTSTRRRGRAAGGHDDARGRGA